MRLCVIFLITCLGVLNSEEVEYVAESEGTIVCTKEKIEEVANNIIFKNLGNICCTCNTSTQEEIVKTSAVLSELNLTLKSILKRGELNYLGNNVFQIFLDLKNALQESALTVKNIEDKIKDINKIHIPSSVEGLPEVLKTVLGNQTTLSKFGDQIRGFLNKWFNQTLLLLSEQSQSLTSSCSDLRIKNNKIISGIHKVYPYACCPNKFLAAYCEVDETENGWTIIQRRTDLPVRENFQRPWKDYVNGFGSLEGEFWIGLDAIYALTTNGHKQKLRIEMEDYEGNKRFAEYKVFLVEGPGTNYRLSVEGYIGDAGDSFSTHNGNTFSTIDVDNDKDGSHCAKSYKGGWWYGACHKSNLNGLPHKREHVSYADGINWFDWMGYHYSLKKVVMKISDKLRYN